MNMYQEIINKANQIDPQCYARAIATPSWGKYKVVLKVGEGYGSECTLVGGMTLEQAEEVAGLLNKREVEDKERASDIRKLV